MMGLWTTKRGPPQILALILLIAFFAVSALLVLHSTPKALQDFRGSRRLSFVLDPKTVDSKVGVVATQNPSRERQELRFLTFGTSNTWGATLENRHEEAYPYLLSKDVTNLALRANGPTFPSVCTQTMVGDNAVYDVIILEYYLRAENLLRLATRLKQHFPNAVIIFLQLWYPELYFHKATMMTAKRWMETNNYGTSLTDPKFVAKLKSTKSEEWFFNPAIAANNALMEAVRAVNGIVWQLPRLEDPIASIIEQAPLFSANDWHHLSAVGHEIVSKGIKEVLHEHHVYRPPFDTVLPWMEGDQCESWFSSGTCKLAKSPTAVVTAFAKKGPKFAMEIAAPNTWITVHNKFDIPQQLHLAFMTTGPAPSLYPKTRVEFRDLHNVHDVVLDPTASEDNDGHNVHVVETRPIAIIPPGATIIHLTPLEKTKNPFRLTGVAITSPGVDLSFGGTKMSSFQDFSNAII